MEKDVVSLIDKAAKAPDAGQAVAYAQAAVNAAKALRELADTKALPK